MHDIPAVDLDRRVQRRTDVPWKQLEETVVLLDLTSGDFFELDEVGGRIWMGLDGDKTLRLVAQELAAGYDVAVEQAGSDVIAFVVDLRDKGLVSIVG